MRTQENYPETRKKNSGKISLDEIEGKIDFAGINQQLLQLQGGRGGRRTTIATLLAPLRTELLKARERNVSYSLLTEFLVKSGIPLSEPTLRQYLRLEDPVRAKRKRKSKEAKTRKGGDSSDVPAPGVQSSHKPAFGNIETSSQPKKSPRFSGSY